jgi:hypothetical protein
MQLQGFSAGVVVDHVPLQEYNVSFSEDGKVATCWIASEAEKVNFLYHGCAANHPATTIQKFSVKWTDLQGVVITAGKVKVDGISCGVTSNDPRTSKTNTSRIKHIRVSDTSVRPLMFSPLELTGVFPLP